MAVRALGSRPLRLARTSTARRAEAGRCLAGRSGRGAARPRAVAPAPFPPAAAAARAVRAAAGKGDADVDTGDDDGGWDAEADDALLDGGMRVQVFDTEEELAEGLCELVEECAQDAIAERGEFTLAIPGGSVTKALAGLKDVDVDWSKVFVFFVNERCPARKNLALAKEVFADAVGLGDDQLFTVGDGTPEEEAQAYQKALEELPAMQRTSYGVPSFDLMLLGTGADGHVGSIYPDSPAAKLEMPGLVHGIDMPEKRSITFGLELMNAAETVVVACTGEKKASMVLKALTGDVEKFSDLPCACVDPEEGEMYWFVDQPAATELFKQGVLAEIDEGEDE